jgi:hypothetical protein
MNGAIPPLPKYAFMAWCSVKKKHRDNFTFTLRLKRFIYSVFSVRVTSLSLRDPVLRYWRFAFILLFQLQSRLAK